VHWYHVSSCQKLSEGFIREFKDRVDWDLISSHQMLSEDFIREFKDKVNWHLISSRQKLSEDFIREFKDKVNWYLISSYQKLSKDFIREFMLTAPKKSWLYATKEEKLWHILEETDYEIHGDHVVAYKSTKDCGHSIFNWQYHYEVGKVYTAHCDCSLQNENSFGLSAWTKEGALSYHANGKLFKVRIPIDAIGAIVQGGQKIRCFELEVICEV